MSPVAAASPYVCDFQPRLGSNMEAPTPSLAGLRERPAMIPTLAPLLSYGGTGTSSSSSSPPRRALGPLSTTTAAAASAAGAAAAAAGAAAAREATFHVGGLKPQVGSGEGNGAHAIAVPVVSVSPVGASGGEDLPPPNQSANPVVAPIIRLAAPGRKPGGALSAALPWSPLHAATPPSGASDSGPATPGISAGYTTTTGLAAGGPQQSVSPLRGVALSAALPAPTPVGVSANPAGYAVASFGASGINGVEIGYAATPPVEAPPFAPAILGAAAPSALNASIAAPIAEDNNSLRP